MGFLIDIINEREKAKYEQNALKLQNNVVEPITNREFLVPNNAKSSATNFWQNVLLKESQGQVFDSCGNKQQRFPFSGRRKVVEE